MTRLNVNDARCEALFVSDLQRSDASDAAALAEIISAAVRQYGIRGCASRMAQEFGDHPEASSQKPASAAGSGESTTTAATGPVPA